MTNDLFDIPDPGKPQVEIYSVSEITRGVRDVLEANFGTIWVEGEISNHRKQSSGHQYFTLKDAQSQLPCVLFARAGSWRKQIALSDGMHVQVRGALTVYEARGQYQLNVQIVQAAGAGLLQAQFEALKRKLEAEGLFDPALKQALPKFPATVAIVTSPTGAALRDMLNILTRRAPWLRVVISPVRVQGEGAGDEIAAAVTELNGGLPRNFPKIDVIVVTRGGGSIEDLWEFNSERLARAIAASGIPVISAVGHEIDFTIADFVADLRAPTPSAAAELVAPESGEILRRLSHVQGQMARCLGALVERQKQRLTFLERGRLFSEPQKRLNELSQRVDVANETLVWAAKAYLMHWQRCTEELLSVLRQHRPDQILALSRQRLASNQQRLVALAKQRHVQQRQRLERNSAMLRLLAPQTVLDRGFSITALADGTLIHSVGELEPGTRTLTTMKDGRFQSEVQEVLKTQKPASQ